MQFLSLGLLPPQDTENTRVEENGANGANGASNLSNDVGKPSAGGRSYRWPLTDDRVPQNSDSSKVETAPPVPKEVLPPKLEALREKLHEQVRPNQAEPLAASVDALSMAERGAVPTFGTFKFGYVPARGLLCSVIGHELVLFALFLLFHYGLPTLHPQRLIADKINSQDHTIYLPELGGGSEGQKTPGDGPKAAPQQSAAPAHASKGFAYPGRQAILSNPPHPDNAFQTVQRPLLVRPEPIRKLVPLPNIIQMGETRLPSDLLAQKPEMPHLKEMPKPLQVKHDSSVRRNAKFEVPVNEVPQLTAKLDMPKLPAAEAPLPVAPAPTPKPMKVTAEKRGQKVAREVSPPSEAQIARAEMHGKAKEPILTLSPMPLPPNPNLKIPGGEAQGRFAIAPSGTLNPNSIAPGKMNMPLSTSPGMGSDKTEFANAATDSNASSGNGAGHATSGGGGTGDAKTGGAGATAIAGTGSGSTTGEGAGGNAGTGKGGRGTSGNGAGSGVGKGAGSGSGGGSGSGTGAFPGITIQGGEDATAKNEPPKFTIEQQPAYAMTVVSTASSGGGLEDFGVFKDERIFTVYIPMKRSEEDEDPTWTLQYALQDESSDNATVQVLAPAPATREWPEVPAALQKKYAGKQVVISAVIDKEGRVSTVAVKRTPDVHVSNVIAKALCKWTFHPAELDGQPVAVKVLFGIPLG